MPSWELVASGRVQGVGYRRFVFDAAIMYGVRGYVRNQPDGTVLIVAEAEENTLLLFCAYLKTGCYYARVRDLHIAALEGAKDYHDFSIR